MSIDDYEHPLNGSAGMLATGNALAGACTEHPTRSHAVATIAGKATDAKNREHC